MSILSKMFGTKTKDDTHVLDSAKVFHFNEDCGSIIGKTRRVKKSKAYKYRLCDICSALLSADLHQKALDLRNHREESLKELFQNVKRLSLPHEQEKRLLVNGAAFMLVTEIVYTLMDKTLEDSSKKHADRSKLTKDVHASAENPENKSENSF